MSSSSSSSSPYTHAPTSIWWDVDNCVPPYSVMSDVTGLEDGNYDIIDNICSAINNLNLSGHISIFMFGRLPQHALNKIYASRRICQIRLSCENIEPTAFYADKADQRLISGLTMWAEQNPAPANICLIAGDVDYSKVLHSMSNQNYNILLSCRHEEASNSERYLKSASHFYWEWQDLIRGRAPQTLPIRHPTGTENGISVWWDLNQSPLPTKWKDGTEVDVTDIPNRLRIALERSQIQFRGPIRIFMYGNAKSVAVASLLHMQRTDMVVHHVTRDKDGNKFMLYEICRWAVHNGGSKCMVISDLQMASGLAPLVRLYHIQIMLALQRNWTSDEKVMATYIWDWPTFLDVYAPPPPQPQPPPRQPPPRSNTKWKWVPKT